MALPVTGNLVFHLDVNTLSGNSNQNYFDMKNRTGGNNGGDNGI